MANRHASAIKRARQNARRNERNATLRSALRTAVKKVLVAVERADVTAAQDELPQAVRHSARQPQRVSFIKIMLDGKFPA